MMMMIMMAMLTMVMIITMLLDAKDLYSILKSISVFVGFNNVRHCG